MKRLYIKKVVHSAALSAAGCGRNWDEVCGTRNPTN